MNGVLHNEDGDVDIPCLYPTHNAISHITQQLCSFSCTMNSFLSDKGSLGMWNVNEERGWCSTVETIHLRCVSQNLQADLSDGCAV